MIKKQLRTPLGDMVAIADDNALHILDFKDSGNISRFSSCNEGDNTILLRLESELDAYFKGTLKKFSIPLNLQGTDFQREAWGALQNIPYGETCSYQEQAEKIHNPTAFRAVANANGQNKLSIIIPCHRVIRSNASLGGYGGGIERKKWLLKHEKKFKNS